MRIGVLLLAGLLTGCMVGPDYQRPTAPMALSFKELAGWTPAQPADLQPRGDWWTIFHDPTLDALEQRVAISNQNVRAQEAAFRQAVAVVAEARSLLFPVVALTPSLQRQGSGGRGGSSSFSSTSGFSGFSSGSNAVTTANVQGTVDWEVDLWGRVRRQVESNVATAQFSAADVANLLLSTQAQLAIDYFELRASDSLKTLLDQTQVAFRRSLEIAQNQYNAGVAARSDVITAQTTLAGVQSSDINAGVLRAQLEHAIAVLIGVPPAELTIPPGSLTTNVPVVPAGVPSELLQRRPDIAAAERTMKAENALIGVAVAAYYPVVTVSALLGVVGQPAEGLFSAANRVWSLGASASQTISKVANGALLWRPRARPMTRVWRPIGRRC